MNMLTTKLPPCDECGDTLRQPKTGWGRVFCTQGCMWVWSKKHGSIVRAYVAKGFTS
jgi:hypothetical protein